jgi:hypothetical protein
MPEIEVRDNYHTPIYFNIESEETIDSLKERIEDKWGVPTKNHQYL